jgi:glucose/arabinose dehydrogenase
MAFSRYTHAGATLGKYGFELMHKLLMLIMLALGWAGPVMGQDLPPCGWDRPLYLDRPWVLGEVYCLEEVVDDESDGDMAFSLLTVDEDGTLYALNPQKRWLYTFADTNADGVPDTPEHIATFPAPPGGLTYHDGAVYISAGAFIYQWDIATAELTPIVDDLPQDGAGFWTGGLTVGPDERLYVGLGANCDFCEPDAGRGAIYSFALDGTDRRLEAQGLRHPAGLAFWQGELWVVDSARAGLAEVENLDELNRVTRSDVHFGFPYCVGANQPDLAHTDFDCAQQATAPEFHFATQSNATSLSAYHGEAFPQLHGSLIITFSGSDKLLDLRGYTVNALHPASAEQPIQSEVLVPVQSIYSWTRNIHPMQELHYRLSGFYPNRPIATAISPEGWIYISLTSGRIMVLRPA